MPTAIIAEYNPFHLGHLRQIKHIKETDECNLTVVFMSGNYVQRGEPAIFDKYLRTKSALLCGADVVCEIPVFFSTATAEMFAYAVVCMINSLHVIDKLCFGSESGDITELKKTADFLCTESTEYKAALAAALATGMSFPSAREYAVSLAGSTNSINSTNILREPNNILAVEYLKALQKTNSDITPVTIKRHGGSFHSHDINEELPSATAIRLKLRESNPILKDIKNKIPNACYDLIQSELKSGKAPVSLDDFSSLLHYILRTQAQSPERFRDIADISEGLENLIMQGASHNFYISDIINAIKTKRYTYTRLQRAVLHIILGIKRTDQDMYFEHGGYIKVLGFRKSTEGLLKEMCKKSDMPVITNLKNADKQLNSHMSALFKKEIQLSEMYYSAAKLPVAQGYEYTKAIIKV